MHSLPANIQVMYFFQNLSEDIQSEFSKGAEGLTPTEINLLMNLGTPMRMSKLAKAIFCLPSNVTVLVDKFEKAGLLERRRSTEDRRAIQVALTEKGSQIRGKVIQKIQTVVNNSSVLDNSDFERILEIILKKKSKPTEKDL